MANPGNGLISVDQFGSASGGDAQIMRGFSVNTLFGLINAATVSAETKLAQIQARQSSISIGDMFEMQMLMNHLSQLTEMSTSVVNAANTATMSIARGVKG
jgi:hypothetical protein